MDDNARRALLTTVARTLDSMNGPDIYDPNASADDPLVGNKKFFVPRTLLPKFLNVDPKTIGLGKIFNASEIQIIAAVNYYYLRTANHPHAALVSWLRAEIANKIVAFEDPEIGNPDNIKAKFTRISEITVVDDVAGLTIEEVKKKQKDENGNDVDVGTGRFRIALFSNVFDELFAFLTEENKHDINKMVSLLPVFAAIQFQKTNHHYISNDDYREAYRRHFKSAQIESLAAAYNKPEIIYDAVHWMGPNNMDDWGTNLDKDEKLPRGISMKLDPFPAGTAIISTQLAIWRAIEVYPGGDALIRVYKTQLDKMKRLDEKISEDKLDYHVFASLFGFESKLDHPDTEEGMSAANQLAGIAQAFIETVAENSDLSKARALKKRAEQNIAIYSLAKEAFKGVSVRIRRDAREKSLEEALVPAIKRSQNQQALVPRVVPVTTGVENPE